MRCSSAKSSQRSLPTYTFVFTTRVGARGAHGATRRVAAEASAGINDVLNRQSGREPPRGEAVPIQLDPAQGSAAARN